MCITEQVAYLWSGIQHQSFMVSVAVWWLLFEIKFRKILDVCEWCPQWCLSFCHSPSSVCLSLQVWSLEQPDWHCKIDEGSIGLVSSRWSPDGRHILNTTEFHVSVKLVCASVHAFMRTQVCLCISLSGFNCCWPTRKGDLKIARHQSLPWTPLHPPSAACIQPDFIAPLLLASCHTWVSSTSRTWVQCVCVLPM